MKTVYFVRHGECQANLDCVISGSRNDSPLTEKGRNQAKETAETFKDKKIDLIVASPLSRVKETAQIVSGEIGYVGDISIEPLLSERDFGSVTGLPLEQGFADLDAGKVKDAETLGSVAERMLKVLDLLAKLPGENILVCGSSGAERMMRAVYEGKDFFEVEPLHNGQIREYSI